MANPNDLDPKALKKALSLLRAHDRFEAEVRRELQKSGFEQDLIEPVVSYLIERRFIDDRRTTTNEIEQNSGRRSVGRILFRERLLARGAPDELIDELLAEEPESELAQAVELLKVKYRTTDDRRKGGRYLCGKGFDESVVEQALEHFFGSVDEYGE